MYKPEDYLLTAMADTSEDTDLADKKNLWGNSLQELDSFTAVAFNNSLSVITHQAVHESTDQGDGKSRVHNDKTRCIRQLISRMSTYFHRTALGQTSEDMSGKAWWEMKLVSICEEYQQSPVFSL